MPTTTTSTNTDVPATRTFGRTFAEALVWGSGFAIGAGAMSLIWRAVTRDDKPTHDEIDEGED
jgi:hypothetical protein